MKYSTITVGIPAFNEGKNIALLLNDLIKQKYTNSKISKIIISSDGSTDDTVSECQKISSKNVNIIINKDRQGINRGLNQIIKNTNTDVLVLLDADIKIKDPFFIEKLVSPIVNDNYDLTSANIIPIQLRKIFQKILWVSIQIKNIIFLNYNHGDNLYTCHGPCRGLSRRYYSKLVFNKNIGNDMYSYIQCDIYGYKYKYVKNTEVYYQLPDNYVDHRKQSSRFVNSINIRFDQYKIPLNVYLKSLPELFSLVTKNIIYVILYVAVQASIYLTLKKDLASTKKWSIATSSKIMSDNETNVKTIIFSSYDDIKNPYYGGGGAKAIHKIAVALASEYKVTIISGIYPHSQNETIDGVNYYHIGLIKAGPKIGQLIFQLLLPIHVLTKKYSIWFESFTPPFSTGCLQLFTKKPIIGLVHMLAGEDMKRKYHLPFKLFEKYGLKTYKYFITTTIKFENIIKQINPMANVVCIPNGVDIIVNRAKLTKHGRYLLYIGRIEVDQKGIDLLLKSFYQIIKDSNIKLFIAGSGTKKEIQKTQVIINKLALQKSVKLLGKIDGIEKIDYLTNAECIVLPSRFETFSMVALEAITARVPLVTFDIEGLNWLPNNCALKTTKFQIDEYAKNVQLVLNNKNIKQKLISNGFAYSKKYSWVKSAELYKQFIKRIIK